MRVLLAEDDALLGDGLRAGLVQAGFDVDWVRDGEAAFLAATDGEHAAIVLDIGLPRRSGFDVLARIRARGSRVPVLLLTARDAVADRVRGLDGGADDYVVKPVDLHELAARLRALTRRAGGEAAPVLAAGELELDPASRRVRYRGAPVTLKPREFDLLREFMLNRGRVLTREQLEGRLYAWGDEVESNAVEVHIHHLRRKLAPAVIRTVRGVGYLMPRDGDA
jgi:two-component system OmpR family response regulator/two-component system response regulator QseB